MKSFFGYPGGKTRLATRLLDDVGEVANYAEPFAGGFSVGLTLLQRATVPVWLNDLDPDVVALWKAVLRHTDEFCELIQKTTPTVETFYRVRANILTNKARSAMTRAIDKLLVHKLSYSNMGEKAASPVGGKHQTGAWQFNVRWNPDSICQSIRRVAGMFGDVRLTSYSVFKMLSMIQKGSLVYLDPPMSLRGISATSTL